MTDPPPDPTKARQDTINWLRSRDWKVDLEGDQWAQLHDPATLTPAQRTLLEQAAEMRRQGQRIAAADLTVAAFVRAWSLAAPIPIHDGSELQWKPLEELPDLPELPEIAVASLPFRAKAELLAVDYDEILRASYVLASTI